MKFKPFYIHSQHQTTSRRSPKKGFTAYISPSSKKRECKVQITFCSNKDQFCKKIGREEVLKAVEITCNPRQVAKILGEAYVYSLYGPQQAALWAEERFFYVYKYMI
jgi:ribosomal protein L15